MLAFVNGFFYVSHFVLVVKCVHVLIRWGNGGGGGYTFKLGGEFT